MLDDLEANAAEVARFVNYVEIDAGGWRFQLRVAAVCVWRDHVLLQGALDGDFWVLPGGRVLPLEQTADGLVRTMRWELDQEVTVKRLLWSWSTSPQCEIDRFTSSGSITLLRSLRAAGSSI